MWLDHLGCKASTVTLFKVMPTQKQQFKELGLLSTHNASLTYAYAHGGTKITPLYLLMHYALSRSSGKDDSRHNTSIL